MSNAKLAVFTRQPPLSLRKLCEDVLLNFLEKNNYHSKLINDLCKRVPHHLLESLFQVLLERNVITDVALLAFLLPDRTELSMKKAVQIRNATFRQISLNCPNLRSLDLSDCVQVCNSVVTCILQGCPALCDLRLDRCHRITDAAFDSTESLFHPLIGCLSLESISLQGCPQLTGAVVATLNKLCHKLTNLNLSQCKRIETSAIRQLFEHHQIVSLNLSYIDGVSDDAFFIRPSKSSLLTTTASFTPLSDSGLGLRGHITTMVTSSPLQKLHLGRSTITDVSIHRMSFLSHLTDISLQWCSGITDEGIIALSKQCLKLQDIDLKSCQITDTSLEAIALNCLELRHLDLSWCTGVSDQGFAQFSHQLVVRGTRNIFNESIDSKRGLQSLCIVWCSQLTDNTIAALLDVPSLCNVDLSGCSGMTEAGASLLRTNGVEVKNENWTLS